ARVGRSEGQGGNLRYPKRFKAMTAVSAVVLTALAFLLLGWAEIGPIRHPELFVTILLILGIYITWCVAMYRRADDTATVDDSGIVYRVPGHSPLTLRWPEIAAVRARDLLQRLDLVDVT